MTPQLYSQLRLKINQFESWRNGRTSYRVEEIPPNVPKVSNHERSLVEVYEFKHNPPARYTVYIKREVVSAGVVGKGITATTWMGHVLGHGKLGQSYRIGRKYRNNIVYRVEFQAINGHTYRGQYYASAGDYAHVRKVS